MKRSSEGFRPKTPFSNVKIFDKFDILVDMSMSEVVFLESPDLTRAVDVEKFKEMLLKLKDGPVVFNENVELMPPQSAAQLLNSGLHTLRKLFDEINNNVTITEHSNDQSCFNPDLKPFANDFEGNKIFLTDIIYKVYKERVFPYTWNFPVKWSRTLNKAPGVCWLKKVGNERESFIELSDSLIKSVNDLELTMMHQLCHAANWAVHGECGHSYSCQYWFAKFQKVTPHFYELPQCNYLYTYNCIVCGAKASGNNIVPDKRLRCAYCFGPVEVTENVANDTVDTVDSKENVADDIVDLTGNEDDDTFRILMRFANVKVDVFETDEFAPMHGVQNVERDVLAALENFAHDPVTVKENVAQVTDNRNPKIDAYLKYLTNRYIPLSTSGNYSHFEMMSILYNRFERSRGKLFKNS